MAFAVSIHFAVAFLVALCALAFSWNDLGRRVVNAALGLQIVVGLIVLGFDLAGHQGFHHDLIPHVGFAVGAALFYGVALGISRGGGDARLALGFSIAGLAFVATTLIYGMRMFLHG